MRDKLRLFMAGRNGVDALNMALLAVSVVLSLLSRVRGLAFLYLISMAALIFAVFRMLSRNLAARSRENAWYYTRYSKAKTEIAGFIDRTRQCRDYKFFSCPGCRNRLRVPRGKGKLQITCPRCGHRFSGKT